MSGPQISWSSGVQMSSMSVIHWLMRRRVSSSLASLSGVLLCLALSTASTLANCLRSSLSSIFRTAFTLTAFFFRDLVAAFFAGFEDLGLDELRFFAGRRVFAKISSS
jgi:hypothetical protein